jgi:iron-sulfur cluster assembly protein
MEERMATAETTSPPAAGHPLAGEAPPIQLTEAAIKQVRWLLARQNNPELFLRVGVKGGGCSGYSYVLNLETERSNWDTAYDFDGVPVVIDKKSQKILSGTTLDFDTTNLMEGAGWIFHNPNAKKTCGCGTSFNL